MLNCLCYITFCSLNFDLFSNSVVLNLSLLVGVVRNFGRNR